MSRQAEKPHLAMLIEEEGSLGGGPPRGFNHLVVFVAAEFLQSRRASGFLEILDCSISDDFFR